MTRGTTRRSARCRAAEALDFYTQGVDAKPNDARLKEALLLNYVACNLELRASFLALSLPFLSGKLIL